MKIVADNKIPYLKGVLEPFADVVYLPGSSCSNVEAKIVLGNYGSEDITSIVFEIQISGEDPVPFSWDAETISPFKAKEIEIMGKAPGGGFSSLKSKGFRPSEKNKAGKETGNPTGEYSLVDGSSARHGTFVIVEPRRGVKIKALYPKIVKYVTKSISVSANVVNEDGKVQCCGIDNIMLYNYQIYF